MPFKSKAQQGFLFSQKPEIAKKFAAETSKEDYKKLPDKKPSKWKLMQKGK